MADAVNPDFQLIFDSVDSDRSGRISATELQQAMARTGENVSIEGCQLLIGLFDDSTQGSIDIQGFAKLVNLHVSWRTIFQSFDKDNSGFIDAGEMKEALKRIFKGKVNPINPNPIQSSNVKTKVKFEKEYIDMLLTKFGSSNGASGKANAQVQFPLTANTTPTATSTSKPSKKGPRLGLDEEQFLLACAFVQKNPPMKESKPDKKKKEK